MSVDESTLTKLATVVWGPYGTNGLQSEVKDHRGKIGDLYGRDETLRSEVSERLDKFEQRQNAKLDGLYKMVAGLIVSILVGTGGIVATILLTQSGAG